MSSISRSRFLPGILNNVLPILFLFLWLSTPCSGVSNIQDTAYIASQLCDSLRISKPVILDIRCGEWTPGLELELRRILLRNKTDLREIDFDKYYDINQESDGDSLDSTAYTPKAMLQSLGLPAAELLEITLEQTYETGEKRNILSYSRYQVPVYRFVLKHISMPEQRLLSMQEFCIKGSVEMENPGSILALKWYEPIVATAMIGALLIMLWTLK